MLDNIDVPELLANHVETISKPFAQKHKLIMDEVLGDYCRELMANTRVSLAASQIKVLNLMDLIECQTIKADILLEVMRRSTIPWSQELKLEIDQAPKYFPSSLMEDFQLQLKLMNVKLMLQRYDINNFNVADTKLAIKLVPYILKQVYKETAVEDAKMVIFYN